ncbi:MAG: CRISPR system precrRNA processing endoribonuclease RAMP protein Cas6 [Caldilineae bacterium]|nr:MAG: CRISPR system precrRNA processing endoribonuclease RAMP protein Cas6 [Caldilineae bacterium]
MTDLLSLALTLQPPEIPAGEPLPAWWGRAAHALALRILDRHDPALAARIHDDPQAARPFTVSSLWGGRITAGEPLTLRLTALSDPMAAALQRAIAGPLAPGSSVELDGRLFTVQAAATDPREHPWAGAASWEELASPWLAARIPNPPRHIALSFASPTTFKTGGRHLPLPLPDLVFGSLLARWNAFAPIALPAEVRRYAAECLVITRHRLHTRRVPLKPGQNRIGMIGEVTFRTLNYDRYWMSTLHLLADFAFYGGLGAGTTMGLGQCRRST